MKAEYLQDYRKLGKKIAVIRITKEISQKELGAAIGTDAYYISKIERASVGLSLDKLFMIARALQVEPWELLHFKELDQYNRA